MMSVFKRSVSSPDMTPKHSLMASVYRQCWPSNRFLSTVSKTPPATARPESGGIRQSQAWWREQLMNQADAEQAGVNGYISGGGGRGGGSLMNGQNETEGNISQGNSKFRAWGSTSNCSVPNYDPTPEDQTLQNGDTQLQDYQTLTGNKISLYPSLYKISQSDIKKFSSQVKELPPSGRVRGSGFKKFYTTESGENVPVVYRSQLAAPSRKAFSDKGWAPYDNKHKDDPPTQCRPVGGQQEGHLSRGMSPAPSPQPPTQARPKSGTNGPNQHRLMSRSPSPTYEKHSRGIHSHTNGSLDRPKENNTLHPTGYVLTGMNRGRSASPAIHTPGRKATFDTLTPEVAYNLSGAQPISVYGDRPTRDSLSPEEDKEGTWADELSGSETNRSSKGQRDKGGRIKTKDGDSSREEDEDDDVQSSTSGIVSDRDTDDDSGEEADEPQLDSIDVEHLPNLQLRPDQQDNIYVPEFGRGDRRKYDFDATNITMAPYEFEEPMSEEMRSVNFKELASQEENWRVLVEKVPNDDLEFLLIDRIIELERLQMKTEEWEVARKEKLFRQARLREAKNKISGTVRHQSAKLRERKCCSDCLQLCCIGDCNIPPPKANSCKACGEFHPGTSCLEHVYSNKKRSERVSLEDEPPKPQPKLRPRSCHSCQRHNPSKVINANNVVLNRPKSGHMTFARGQNNSKQPPSRSASSSQITPDIERELWKLGINPNSIIKQEPKAPVEPQERPSTACAASTTKGRAAIAPGKSYFSQRRSSLTDIAKSTRRAKSAVARPRSTKSKRPKTAS